MTRDEQIQFAVKIAWLHINEFYHWGGDDPSGFDCSGFVVEVLKSTGIVGHDDDMTATDMYNKFPTVKYPKEGCLVLWIKDDTPGEMKHVEIVLNDTLSIGASGGGSKTLTDADAERDNAFIKVRPYITRGGKIFVDPFERGD
jgi:cell wall-associated NlpC family hydrolase